MSVKLRLETRVVLARYGVHPKRPMEVHRLKSYARTPTSLNTSGVSSGSLKGLVRFAGSTDPSGLRGTAK